MSGHEHGGLWPDALWALGVLVALVALFVAGLRLPPMPHGWRRWLGRALTAVAAAAVVVAANVALYRNDVHLDLTHERVFTPSDDAARVVAALSQDVELIYFYQKGNPAARHAVTMVELMGRMNPRLKVRVIDPDQNPGMSSRYGVRLYNAALLISEGRRLEVPTTDDREIALAILRVTRSDAKTVCFVTDHGEYDIDNFEFHTHFEGTHSHSHDIEGMAVVQMEQHGIGRLRRALDKLGIKVRKITVAGARAVPEDCTVLVDANPRTQHAPSEADLLRAYLARGGSALFLFEPDYVIEPRLGALLKSAGTGVGDGVVIDPSDHYYTDEQMVAVTKYAAHPATRHLALSFFPGVRPLSVEQVPGIRSQPLFSSSASSYVVTDRLKIESEAATAPRGARPLAMASEGTLSGGTRPFRMIVFGDADFASNSFFPYLSNADLVLGSIAWLMREESAPTMKPPVEVLPRVTLTNSQMRWIFLVTVIGLPGAIVLAGAVMWWRRR
ncbi:MAG: Gldg family protein [Alphaproteobacteria bacterium]|nr:Gldg family protein [Alphaproteobacteria bacterium]